MEPLKIAKDTGYAVAELAAQVCALRAELNAIKEVLTEQSIIIPKQFHAATLNQLAKVLEADNVLRSLMGLSEQGSSQ